MQSMRAPSLALAYCLTARAVPGPHRPSRPKWELGLQVFDYFEEPGLGRRPHNHHHHSLQKVPSRPAGRRFAEKPQQSSLPAAGSPSPAYQPTVRRPNSKQRSRLQTADLPYTRTQPDCTRMQQPSLEGASNANTIPWIRICHRFTNLWSLCQ